MREIAVVTTARSDFGLYIPVLETILEHSELDLKILASGMHLAPEFGRTVDQIEAAGFEVFERVESLVASDTPEAITKSIGLGIIGFAQVFSRWQPDILLLLGDRFDMYAATVAALPFRIPIAHLHGGEVTEGAIDEAFRHSITKMAHLHFPATEVYAERIRQMGEEDWRIKVVGAPGLDNIRKMDLMTPEETAETFKFQLDRPVVLVTFHPVTLEYEHTEVYIKNLLDALDSLNTQILFTYPNADTAGRIIIQEIESFCSTHPGAQAVKNAGQRGYLSLLNTVSAMVGNSSSGIIEAASFKLPVVNIGSRQRGRHHLQNVVDSGYRMEEILAATLKVLDSDFRMDLVDLTNPYGDGHAAERIVERLSGVELGPQLIFKRFASHPEPILEVS